MYIFENNLLLYTWVSDMIRDASFQEILLEIS